MKRKERRGGQGKRGIGISKLEKRKRRREEGRGVKTREDRTLALKVVLCQRGGVTLTSRTFI